jgi:ribosomal-protein-alanine N-acetyltransferase
MSGAALSSTRPTWRPMTTADLERVMAVEVQAYPFPWSRGHFADSLAAGYQAQLLLRDDRLLGYYVAMSGVQEMHLLNLTVAPEHQRQGHARHLLAHLAASARAAGAAQVWLEVRESNARARALYERWGFEPVGRRKGYYPAGHGRREDALVMRWAVPAAAPQETADGLD